jgi:hypothetical protein
LISNDAEAWYNGIEFEWSKRLSSGLQFQAAYTFSEALDTNSEATFVGTGDSNQNGPSAQYAKGFSRFHTPHRFTLNGSYRLPFFADRSDLLGLTLGGWQLSGVLKLASGTPFTVIDTGGQRDLDFDGFTESRPVIVDPSILNNSVDHPSVSQTQLPRAAFRSVTFSDSVDDLVPRNSFFTDGTNNVDLALAKVFDMPWSGHSLSVRFEAFNAFNQVQFSFPQNDLNAVNFGAIVAAHPNYSPRVLQLVLRYRY